MKAIPSALRLRIMAISRSKVLLMRAGSVPSTSMRTPRARKGLAISWPSRAIMPSLREMVPRLTSCSISASGLSILCLTVFMATPMEPMNSGNELLARTAVSVPPMTMYTDGMSMKGPGSPMDMMIRPKVATKPMMVAISMVSLDSAGTSMRMARLDGQALGYWKNRPQRGNLESA